MAVQVDADARPVQPRGDLLDVGRFAGAVVALHQHPPVVREAGEDGERRIAVEAIGLVDLRDVLLGLTERRRLEIAVDAEGLADRYLDVRHANEFRIRAETRRLNHAAILKTPSSRNFASH